MVLNRIIVLGASAGGFETIKTLVKGLPSDLSAALLIVWHMSADVRGILPQELRRLTKLQVDHAIDGDIISGGRIFVAPPDHHMLVEQGRIRLTRGPKENRFRPAIDPLFRSAALHYGSAVIGVILSGSLDDGSSGLWSIKERGGIAIVQNPREAEVSSMPENAIRAVSVDQIVTVAEMPAIFQHYIETFNSSSTTDPDKEKEKMLLTEVGIALQNITLETAVMESGDLSPFTCPECQGVLSRMREGNSLRFRCHTGHAYTGDTLLASLTENIEKSLWGAIRRIDENIMLLNYMGDHYAEANEPKLAAVFFQKANEARNRNEIVRQSVLSHEQYSTDNFREQLNLTEAFNFDIEVSRRIDH